MRSQLETTPPYSGADMVADANDAFQTIATDFAGATDPAAMAWPYATWADTGNMLLKRRNAANTDWVVLGPLFDYHYTRGNILGTVSEDSGVPTGALLEYGSNANGEYWRFASGLQICRMRISVTDQAISTAYGSGLYQGTRVWDFPATFITSPAVSCSEFRWGSSASWGTLGGLPSTWAAILRGIDNTSRSAGTETNISAIAVGRWF